jgi:hypothetical protein
VLQSWASRSTNWNKSWSKSWTSHPPGVRFSCLMKQTSIWRSAIRLVLPNATPWLAFSLVF